MATPVAVLLLITSVFWGYTAAFSDIALDCCLSTKNVPIPRQIVVSYITQTVEGGCRITATVFVTKKDKRLCAPVPEESQWVANLIDHLDNQDPTSPVKKPPQRRTKNKKERQQ